VDNDRAIDGNTPNSWRRGPNAIDVYCSLDRTGDSGGRAALLKGSRDLTPVGEVSFAGW